MNPQTAAKVAAATRAIRAHADDTRTAALVYEALRLVAVHGAPAWADVDGLRSYMAASA